MSKDEKKASVSDYLNLIRDVIHEGIDADAEGDLTPFELIAMTVSIYYHEALIRATNEQRLAAQEKQFQETGKPETIEQLARIYEFPKRNPT
jgi:hypothetical protein